MQRRLRSRSFRRIYVKTPGGDVVIHYKKRKPKSSHCGKCGAVLKGVPRELPYKLGKLAKTERRPERPYGGVLCSRCMRDLFVKEARGK